MSFPLLKQKIQSLLKQPVTKKGLIASGVVATLFFTFQNCSETKFQELQQSSLSATSIEDLCSLDDMRESSVSLGTGGYYSVPLNQTQLRSVSKGSYAYLWINGFQKIEGADWYASKDGGPELALGSGEKITYPGAPSNAAGLAEGNYRIRINMSKICQNAIQNNSNSSALSKAQLEASSRIEKNIYVQFNVIDPQTIGCQSLAGVILNADDPKTINSDVHFSVALPANCSLPVSYNFGDGAPTLENATTAEIHKYSYSGQYTAQARLGSEGTAFKKDLSKNVVILSECPKPQNIFISGPSTLKFGTSGEYELQNYNNSNCNLGITRVTFKKDGTAGLADDVEAPFKTQTMWQSSEAKIYPELNSIVAEVYFNSPEDYGVTNPFIVKKSVNLISSVTGCTPEALASISISGPTSALVNSSLTHLAVVPSCIRQPSFTGNDSVEWSLEEVTPGSSAAAETLTKGVVLTKQYSKIGLFSLKVKIKDTKVGEINLQSYLNILDNMPPVCTLFQYSAWGLCDSTSTRARTVTSSKPLGCTGGSPVLTEPCSTYVPPNCTSHTYTEYGACQADNKKYRSVLTSIPAGCTNGVVPVLSEACSYTPPVCTGFTYTNWGLCQPDSKQYRSVATSTPAGCAGGSPALEQPCTYVAPVCTSFNYTAWGSCQPDSKQYRTVTSSAPAGCSGGTPVTNQPCSYVPPVCSSFNYTEWGSCQPDSKQYRTVTSSAPAGCSGGTPVTNQPCTYVPPVCTSFTYSSWGSCEADNKQRRSLTSSAPTGCSGGSPVLEQPCVYVPPAVQCSGYSYSPWGSCQPDNKQTRSVTGNTPAGCTGTPTSSPVVEQPCTYVPPVVTCTSFNYTAWGSCQTNNKQYRTVTSSAPSGCTGGTPSTEQPCTYVPPVCSFTYSGWGSCQPDNQQHRSVTSTAPAGCSGGTPSLDQPCIYVPPVCSSFSYSAWGACDSTSMQYRSVTGSAPSGCAGGSPVTSQGCTYVPPICSSFTYTPWGSCQTNNTQTRTVTGSAPSGCAGGSPVTSQPCTYVPPVCSSFTYTAWGSCQSNSTQSRSVTGSAPSGCAGGSPVTSQPCTYVPPVCTSFSYGGWGSCQPDNLQYRSATSASPAGCSGGSPSLTQACCYNGGTTASGCTQCNSGQSMSHLTGRCETNTANRWCHMVTSSGPSLGYQDVGAVHEPGCFHQDLNQWYATGTTVNYGGHAIRCDTAGASSYPVPDSNCPANRCGALVSSAACSVTKQCANGKRLAAAAGMVPNTANISGGYLETVDVGQPSVDPNKWRFDSWNANGSILKMQCDNINNQLQWKQVAGGHCDATYFMSQAETDADPNCVIPVNCGAGQVPVNNQCVDECGDVVGTLKVRQAVTSGTGSKRSMMISEDVHMQSHCSDNGFDYIPFYERTVERIMQASRYNICLYPGLPSWYDGGRWVGWNGYVSYGGTIIDGDYKIVRNPRGTFAPGHQTVSAFASQRGLTVLLGASGIGYGDYVCLRAPSSGGTGGGGGGGGGLTPVQQF